MTDKAPTLQEVSTLVVEAIEAATGFLNDRKTYQALSAGQDLSLSALELDSLATFEIIMFLEERLGLELDADAFGPDVTIHGLAKLLTSRLADRDA